MATGQLKLTRAQLSAFLGKDHEAIKQFEKLFQTADEIAPDVVQEIAFNAQSAQAAAQAAQGDSQAVKQEADANITALEARVNALSAVVQQLAANAEFGEPPTERDPAVDYFDLRRSTKQAAKVGRFSWDDDASTPQVNLENNVTLQIGQEDLDDVTNATGSTISKGNVIGLAGVGGGGDVSGKKYLADGSEPSIYVLGISAHDIPNNTDGYVTSRGIVTNIDTTGTSYGETWAVGDILYCSPTTAGGLTKVKPSAPALVIPIAVVLTVSATVGRIACRPTIFLQLYYGGFISTVDQTATAINTATAVSFNTTVATSGVSLGTPDSRIVTANSGVYDFTFTVQAAKSSAAVGYIWVWLRKNGTDIANSALRVAIQGATGEAAITRTIPQQMAANDYMELMWAVDSTTITLNSDAATAFAPAVSSATMAVFQVNQ